MVSLYKKQGVMLFLGDLVMLVLSLFTSLAVRFGELPSKKTFLEHLFPFTLLFLASVFCFFVAGLYEKQLLKVRRRIPELLFSSVLANAVVGISLFYFFPLFTVTPKLVLFLYIVISFLFLFVWRTLSVSISTRRKKESALLLGEGLFIEELMHEINESNRYPFLFKKLKESGDVAPENFRALITGFIKEERISLVVVDGSDPKIAPAIGVLNELLILGVECIEVRDFYEKVFDRVPLGLIKDSWILDHLSLYPHALYDGAKRVMDIIISLPVLLISLVFYPIVFFFQLFEGSRRLFSIQERVGQFGKPIRMIKFRTMLFDDNGMWGGGQKNKVTTFGAFLRKTRLDELPQLINILRGELSLIGPRPEFPKAVLEYEKQIPYYNMRHMIKPGLSGWAQIYHENHPHHGMDIKETKNKLSYDIFYIKNRSIMLDLVIAVKTIKTLLSRQGK